MSEKKEEARHRSCLESKSKNTQERRRPAGLEYVMEIYPAQEYDALLCSLGKRRGRGRLCTQIRRILSFCSE
jgi:hypothetical protein